MCYPIEIELTEEYLAALARVIEESVRKDPILKDRFIRVLRGSKDIFEARMLAYVRAQHLSIFASAMPSQTRKKPKIVGRDKIVPFFRAYFLG